MDAQKYILVVLCISSTFDVSADRLRFIIENQTGGANLFSCLRTHDCNPLSEAEMWPGERKNNYTENFKSGVTKFILKLQTNNETTSYDVIYNNQSKMLQLQREGIVFDEAPYNAEKAQYPPVIRVDKKLDAYFDNDAIYDNQKVTGRNSPNSSGYKPSLYLGDSGPKEPRRDKNRFCSKNSSCRNDPARLGSYAGVCDHTQRHDNMNPFCRKKKIKWHEKRCNSCSKKCK